MNNSVYNVNHDNNNNNQPRNIRNTTNQLNGNNNDIILYYRNHMSTAYKIDEMIMKKIIKNNVKSVDINNIIKVRIFYKNNKTSNLLLINNCLPLNNSILKESHIIYEFSCPFDDCARLHASYIGMTTTTLSRRLTMHKREGTIKTHLQTIHNITTTRDILNNNTSILYKNQNYFCLKLAEAIFIDNRKPKLNVQTQIGTILPTRRTMTNHDAIHPSILSPENNGDTNAINRNLPTGMVMVIIMIIIIMVIIIIIVIIIIVVVTLIRMIIMMIMIIIMVIIMIIIMRTIIITLIMTMITIMIIMV